MATGIATVSKGDAFSWFGGRKSEFSSKSELSVSLGVKTEISIGAKSDLSFALATSISMSSKLEAAYGKKLSYGKTDSFETKLTGSFTVMDSYNGAVGHNALQLVTIKALREALGVLLSLQAASMLAAATAVVVMKFKEPDDKSLDIPNLGINLSDLMSMVTAVSTLSAAIQLFFHKIIFAEQKTKPTSLLSMDKVGSCFLGIKTNALASVASGLTINDSKIALTGPTEGAEYVRPPGGNTTLGISGGTSPMNELAIDKTGTKVQGKNFSVNVSEKASIRSDTSVVIQVASSPSKEATTAIAPVVGLPEALVQCTTEGIMLQSGKGATKSSIALDEASLFASAGGPSAASLVLCSSMASLGMAGNNLSLTTSGAVFTFGSTALKLDAMGLSMGSAFTILNPGPPGLMYSGLQKTLQKVTKLNAEMALQRKAFELLQMKQEALEAANKKLNEALVAARNQVNAATQTSVSQ